MSDDRETLMQQLRECVSAISTHPDLVAELHEDSGIVQARVSSLAMISLIFSLEERFDIEIPDTALTPTNLYSLRSLCALVLQCRGGVAKPQ